MLIGPAISVEPSRGVRDELGERAMALPIGDGAIQAVHQFFRIGPLQGAAVGLQGRALALLERIPSPPLAKTSRRSRRLFRLDGRIGRGDW